MHFVLRKIAAILAIVSHYFPVQRFFFILCRKYDKQFEIILIVQLTSV